MKEKSNRLKSIRKIIAIALVVPLFILSSQTSSLAVQPQVAADSGHTVGVKSDGMVVAVGNNSNGQRNMFDWNLQLGVFEDIPPDYWAEEAIYKIYEAGITKGCSQDPLKYCPEDIVTRDQMAVFLGRAKYGGSHTPPPAIGIFRDVPISYWAANWIELFYDDGITMGCSHIPLRYCPASPVTRAQMAIFLLRSKYGSSYTPPPASGIFADVPVGSFAANWIEALYNEGITTGCQSNPLRYCPDSNVTRAQMAVFIVPTFDL